MKIHSTYKKYGFTLIELMVVITIIGIVSLATYLPYAHHQKKVLLKQGAKELVQSLTEARNLAINGVNDGAGNLNVGLYFTPDAEEILYYVIDFQSDFDLVSLPSEVYKTKKIPPGIRIDSITGNTNESLFGFSAISGDLNILSSDTGYTIPNTKIVEIQLSYKGASTSVLQKKIEYYTQSYISDY